MPEQMGTPHENTVQHGIPMISRNCVWDGVLVKQVRAKSRLVMLPSFARERRLGVSAHDR